MILELAAARPDRAQRVLEWPVRDALEAFERHVKEITERRWHEAFARWAAIAPHSKRPGKQPEVPRALR